MHRDHGIDVITMTAMTFAIMHLSGEFESDPPLERIAALIGELSVAGKHGLLDVAAIHQSGWTLRAYPDGRVVLARQRDRASVRCLADVERSDAIRLFELLAVGDIAAIELFPWKPAYD
jgi:hypothetical protein